MAKKQRKLFKNGSSKNWFTRPQWRNEDGSKGSRQVSLSPTIPMVKTELFSIPNPFIKIVINATKAGAHIIKLLIFFINFKINIIYLNCS